MSIPLVSVVMPVKDETIRLQLAAKDILNQKRVNLELLILDDGSASDTASVIRDLCAMDSRVRSFKHDTTKGRAAALNTPIQHANGDFIAIADSDDRYALNRLALQVRHFEQNPETDICGTFFSTIPKHKHWELFTSNVEIRTQMIFNYPFVHPSLMYRKSVFEKGLYNENYTYAMDYNLTADRRHDLNFANLPVPLMTYYFSDKSSELSEIINQESSDIRNRILREDFKISDNTFCALHNDICSLRGGLTVNQIEDWIDTLINNNTIYNPAMLKGIVNAQASRYLSRFYAHKKTKRLELILKSRAGMATKIKSAVKLLR